jgi:hypothetical protein
MYQHLAGVKPPAPNARFARKTLRMGTFHRCKHTYKHTHFAGIKAPALNARFAAKILYMSVQPRLCLVCTVFTRLAYDLGSGDLIPALYADMVSACLCAYLCVEPHACRFRHS